MPNRFGDTEVTAQPASVSRFGDEPVAAQGQFKSSGVIDPAIRKIPLIGNATADTLEGAGGSLAQHVVNIYDILRKIPGADKVLPDSGDLHKAISGATPDTTPAHVGKFIESAIEYMAPADKAAELTKGSGLLARSTAQATSAGGAAAVQSGGNPAATAAGVAAGAAGPVIGDATSALWSKLFDAHPDIALVKALRPPPSDSKFIERLPDARADIKAAGTVTDNESLLKTAPLARNANRQAWEAFAAPARAGGVQTLGTPIVQATVQSIPETLWRENPVQASDIVNTASRAYGGNLDVETLEKLLKEKNAELDSFFDKSTGKQNASVQSGNPQAVVKAQRDAIADTLYKTLDPANDGAGPREIQQRYGAIRTLEDAATRRRNAIIGEQAVSPAGKAVKVAQAAGKAAKLDPEAALDTLAGSNSLIRRAFSNTGDARPFPAP